MFSVGTRPVCSQAVSVLRPHRCSTSQRRSMGSFRCQLQRLGSHPEVVISQGISWENMGVSENSVPLNPMVLLIIIPIKWLFHWEHTLFSDKPIWANVGTYKTYRQHIGTMITFSKKQPDFAFDKKIKYNLALCRWPAKMMLRSNQRTMLMLSCRLHSTILFTYWPEKQNL